MLLVYDILIYVFFAFFASKLARKSERYITTRHLPTNTWDQYLICFMLFFALIGGIRWNVGADSIGYARAIAHPDSISENAEPLFDLICNIIHSLGLHWSLGLALWSFIQIFFITKALQPYRYLLVLMPFVFLFGRYWFDAMNVMRQMMVACAFLWASRFIIEKKPIKYVLFIAIASLMHKSVVMLLPFYFFPINLKVYKHRVILIVILIACVAIGQSPAFEQLSYYANMVQTAAGYDNYGNHITNLLENGTTNALSFGPTMLSFVLIPIFIIWYFPSILKKYGRHIPYLNFWYNVSYLYSCLYFLVCNISEIFLRPITYLLLFQMVMATVVLYYLLQEAKQRKKQVEYVCYCLVIFTNIGWSMIKFSGLPAKEESTTYKIFIFHEEESKTLGLY